MISLLLELTKQCRSVHYPVDTDTAICMQVLIDGGRCGCSGWAGMQCGGPAAAAADCCRCRVQTFWSKRCIVQNWAWPQSPGSAVLRSRGNIGFGLGGSREGKQFTICSLRVSITTVFSDYCWETCISLEYPGMGLNALSNGYVNIPCMY